MIKRTVGISSPAKLSLRQKQILLSKTDALGQKVERTIPIEDIGAVVMEDPRITITHGLIAALLANNVALITCDARYHPTGMMLNLCGNTTQAESFRHQTEASQPLKKQLWQQVVKQKIENQATVLQQYGVQAEVMLHAARDVKSGDTDNREGVAAAYYWPRLFETYPGFTRGREAGYPNNLLNYGYAILRAVIARSLVGSGLMPTLGIFHHNRYNQYCLADDMMEPYRPFVDIMVAAMVDEDEEAPDFLNKEQREELLTIPRLTVSMDGKQRPLMIAASETSASLVRCFNGEQRRLILPQLE